MAWTRERMMLYCLAAPLMFAALFTAGSAVIRPVVWHLQGVTSSGSGGGSSRSGSSDSIGAILSAEASASEAKGTVAGTSSGASPLEQATKVEEKKAKEEEEKKKTLIPVDPKKVQRAEEALRQQGPDATVEKAVHYLINGASKEEELAQFESDRECKISENTDYDGYAVTWGIGHLTKTAAECCEACKKYQPKPPSYFVCNVWVWCGKEICFAPAAHNFTYGQCWLKHQDDPTNPQINMKGKYTPEYHKRHPNAPEYVDWTAGVVVKKGTKVTNGTWSPRASW